MSKILDKLKTFDGYLSLEEVNSDIDLVKEEFSKFQYRLEIQTKRVENLKKSNEFYADMKSWHGEDGTGWEQTHCIDHDDQEDVVGEWIEAEGIDLYEGVGGKLARSCQAIDQELEKQLEGI